MARQELKGPLAAYAEEDSLLNMVEIMEGWDLTAWQVRTLIMERRIPRLRRFGKRAYYPLSSVVQALGDPLHPLTPRYPSWTELTAAA